ncbi:DinB family protein [Flavobacterium sp. RSP49]|uniref:DinB family protein n=1 Tax=unclassified Flavobacterium TaxID=196869 RepID=UPI000F827A5E|nr:MULTISPECIES: DinB family protein [unclassified Flavobacterium]RTY68843.1 DinB family protein [Flavobacterium sp. LB2P53]RTY86697.1 DinB family protein [Flavobacterium sp. RSP15]RTY90429.1 DinB family protein [Flavobacterium sp. RSP46]RTZ01650.1 DinB family protein [Flavobacterium sp. RSP49]
MNQILDITLTSRKIVSQFLKGYTLAQLNTIPEGFNNNLIWNIGHIIVTQQVLVYKLSGLPMMVSEEMVEKYKKGTKPEHIATQEELAEMKDLLFETINQTKLDFENKNFKNFTEYPTSTGYTLESAQDAMAFNDFHEGLHIGIMMSIRKFI